MPLIEENGSPVEPEVTQTEIVEKQPEPTPETPEAEDVDGKKPEDAALSKGVQKRIDRLTRQKYEAQAKAEYLERQLREREGQAGTESRGIDRSQFASDEDYVEALVESRLAAKEAEKQQQSYKQRVSSIIKEAEKLGDFDAEEFAEVPITKAMADAIVDSDVSAQLVKFFHDDPDEAERISKLTPARQAAAIGRIELQLSGDNERKPAAKTAAPSPIRPVTGSGKASTGYRPDMSMAEYAKWRKAQK